MQVLSGFIFGNISYKVFQLATLRIQARFQEKIFD